MYGLFRKKKLYMHKNPHPLTTPKKDTNDPPSKPNSSPPRKTGSARPTCIKPASNTTGAIASGLYGDYGAILSERNQNPRLPTRPIGRNGGHGELLWNAALRHLTPIKPINPNHTGDIILLRMMQSASAKHLAVLADANGGFQTIIHAYSGVGVVETPLTPSWQRRIVAQFRFPERS